MYQVSSRGTANERPPKKPISPARRRWSTLLFVLRYINGVAVVGGLFGLSLIFVHTRLIFILLPAGVSVVITAITTRSQVRNFKLLLLTTCLAVAFFGVVAGWELLTHNPSTPEIIVVTTTLTAAVIVAPVRSYVRTLLEERFHLRDDATSKSIEAFTSALREEIDLKQVRERFFDVVETTLHPQVVSLWLRRPADAVASTVAAEQTPSTIVVSDGDPFVPYALQHPAAVEVARLQLDSAVVRLLERSEVEIALPLPSQGDLLGLLALGPRRDGQEYSWEDRDLLTTLAAPVVPALRVAQMVAAEKAQVSERARIEEELRTAQVIQRTFLPKDVPTVSGCQLVPFYQPAREVGGDFYDFLPFEDGRLGLVIGDVTGKGIPAALVMTAVRTMLRTAAQEHASPATVFARVNDLLAADIPAGMFVTCFYAVLDPATARLLYTNAGQDFPYVRHQHGGACELRARGMPLGLMTGTGYEEQETTLAAGDSLLFFSDGLVEAHNPDREMFGLPRVQRVVEAHDGGAPLIDALLAELKSFVEPGWEQEDDVTLVTLQYVRDDAQR